MDYKLFDADNHYYEAEDAFTRYGDDEVKSFVRWMTEGKRRHIVFGKALQTMVPNPTFNPIAKPGVYHSRLRELAQHGDRRNIPPEDKARYGELEPLSAAYRERGARLEVMDEQGVERAVLLPTLAVGIEGLNPDNPRMTYKLFHAFNRWLEDDWGFDYNDRIYAVPAIPVLDPDLAAAELESVLARGAKFVVLRPGPAAGRSPADPSWDRFWGQLNDADVPVIYHAYGGVDAYESAFRSLWQRYPATDETYEHNLLTAWIGDRPMLDTALALVLGNLFGRFPRLRVLSIELGGAWVPFAMQVLDHAGGLADRHIEAFGAVVEERPSDIFKRHFWVSPFPEEDVVGLTQQIGVDRVLFGSDFPHMEGTEQPADYARYLDKLDPEDVRRIMRDNALALVKPA